MRSITDSRSRRSFAATAAAVACAAALVTALGCATAPPTAPPPTPPPPAAAVAAAPELPPDAALVCGSGSRTVEFQQLGVPPEALPIDLTLGADAAWVLFRPSFLLRVARAPGADEEPVFVSPNQEGEEWLGVDVDPIDGSLWLARRDAYEMVQVVDSRARRVPLQRITGEGGLVEIVAGAQSLHVTPFCADHALWTFDREGDLLGASFELPQGLGLDVDPGRAIVMDRACTRLLLGRDASGSVIAFHPVDVRLHREGAEGWEEIGGPFDIRPPDRYAPGYRVAGLDPGATVHYLPDLVAALAVLDGRPTLLGAEVHIATGETIGTLLYRVEGDELHPVVEHCGGRHLLDLEADSAGHAALTRKGLILGGQ
jgi:hypothetical protein